MFSRASRFSNACAWDVPGLFVMRFFTGIGLSAMTVTAITYISEMFPAKKRGTYQAWVMTIGLAGIPISAFVAGELIPKAIWGCGWYSSGARSACSPFCSPASLRNRRFGIRTRAGLPMRIRSWVGSRQAAKPSPGLSLPSPTIRTLRALVSY